jgi:hypothetical protein
MITAVGAMAMPAVAAAQGPFAPVGYLVGEYGANQPLSQDKQAFALVFINGATNSQIVQGTFAGAPFGGAAMHTYDRATDTVTYNVSGSADPTGAAPPVPIVLRFELTYQRAAESRSVTVTGTNNGQPIVGDASTFTYNYQAPTAATLVP